MQSSIRSGVLLLMIAGSVPFACSDSSGEKRRLAELAEGCILDSDCEKPLVCVFERCHEECEESRDCPPSQRCVTGERGLNVCLFPSESECTRDSGCLGDQICAADWECRDPCDAGGDCVGAQLCESSGVCAEPDEVDDDGNLILPESSSSRGDGGTSSDGGSSGAGAMGGSGGGSGSGGSGGTVGSGGGAAAGGTEGGSAGSGPSGSGGGSGSGGTAGGQGGSAGSQGGAGGTAGGCPAGTAECDDDPDTVCETDVTLVTRCGGCDTACNGAHGAVTCQAGACVLLGCNSGYGDCDGDVDTGCEEALDSNGSHCGACNRDCESLGATCNVNQCSVPTVHSALPISNNNSAGLTWAYGNGLIFNIGFNNYTLRAMPIDGSAVTTVWSASATAGRYSLVANDTEVIWAERGTPNQVLSKAHSADAADAPVKLFEPEYQPYFLQVHDEAFFWMSGDYQSGDPGGYVYTRAIAADVSDPGARIVLEDQGIHGAVVAFTVSDDALYWYTTDPSPAELRTAALSGGAVSEVPVGTIAAGGSESRVVLKTSGRTLYYNQEIGDAFTNGIYRWTPGDAAPTQLVQAEGVADFIVDDEFIYYASLNQSSVRKASLTGGAGVEIGKVGIDRFLHQDDNAVWGASISSSSAYIYRVLK